ncbi:MAG: hypothetical protein NT098_01660 [Candidatus Parcubacteria bacterium]|nr:hypothetical protein [Candidatus Parcubacteria bacterium]
MIKEKTTGTMQKMRERLNFYTEMKEALGIFEVIDYSIITGGFVQNTKKSGDVDIITVLPYKTTETEKQILLFAEKHVATQICNNFRPDFHFPTDVVSRQQIVDATNGRAFEVSGGFLNLKNYSDEEIFSNKEADYRVWLYEMITHDFDLIGGSFDSLVKDTMRALRTIFLYTTKLFEYSKEISIDQLRHDLFASAGLPYSLSEKQCRYLIMMLTETGFGLIENNNQSDVIILNHQLISIEIENLKKGITSKSFSGATHIIDWETIRTATKKLMPEDGGF